MRVLFYLGNAICWTKCLIVNGILGKENKARRIGHLNLIFIFEVDYLLDRKFKRMPRKPKASKTFRRLKCKESVNKGSEPSSTGWGSGCTNPTPGFESSRRRI
ncbi:hypothetical protein VPH35_081278 [Triticum aestivum]